MIIERKTLADLLASIKDGRYEEQSHRLKYASGFPSHNVLYIIEGMFSTLRTIMEKKLAGSCFGSANARTDIPMLLNLYRNGQLDLEGLITNTYTLENLNQGYLDMHSGKNIRGVIVM
jgi:threonine dehydrogenase-like Zn-dependent dehydrogenase